MTKDWTPAQRMARKVAWILLPLWLLSLPGCALCIGGAVGAAAGYEIRNRGYKVQSPVKKPSSSPMKSTSAS